MKRSAILGKARRDPDRTLVAQMAATILGSNRYPGFHVAQVAQAVQDARAILAAMNPDAYEKDEQE